MAHAGRIFWFLRDAVLPWPRSHRTPPTVKWTMLLVRTVRSALHDDFGIAASSIAFAAFLAMIPLIGLITGAYGLFAPPTSVA
ncbi:hypothetical protein QCF01_18645, partial [Staphylococcus aureus]|nr:hypothetical protein [Staphylococcus aureus]